MEKLSTLTSSLVSFHGGPAGADTTRHKTMCNTNWTMGKPNVNLAWHLSTKKFMKNKEKRKIRCRVSGEA